MNINNIHKYKKELFAGFIGSSILLYSYYRKNKYYELKKEARKLNRKIKLIENRINFLEYDLSIIKTTIETPKIEEYLDQDQESNQIIKKTESNSISLIQDDKAPLEKAPEDDKAPLDKASLGKAPLDKASLGKAPSDKVSAPADDKTLLDVDCPPLDDTLKTINSIINPDISYKNEMLKISMRQDNTVDITKIEINNKEEINENHFIDNKNIKNTQINKKYFLFNNII